MSLSKNDVKGIIDDYIDYFERCVEHGEHTVHWNKGCVPTKTDWGLTYSNCPGIGNLCKTNEFADNYQCKGFARFIAYLLTDVKLTEENISTDMNDIGTMWVKITNKSDLENYEFEPGDIIETGNPHGAIVWKVQGETVQFLEVWSSMPYGCQIVWGDYNGGIEGASTKTHLKDIALRVFKCPVIDEGTPAPIPVSFPTPDTGDSGTDEGDESTANISVTYKKNTDPDGGPNAFNEPYTYTVGGKYSPMPDTVEREEGFEFNGWYSEHNIRKDDSLYTDEDTVNVTYDHSLYAHWKYKLLLHRNDGTDTVVESTNYAHTGDTYDTVLSGQSMQRTGYTLTGWKFEGGSDCDLNSKVDNVTRDLYAHWTPNTYNVTLYNNDGTNVSETESFVFGGTYGEKLGALEDRYGYTFKEWNTQSNGEGDSYDKNSKIEAKNLDLYAIWEEKEVNVTYNYGYDVNGTVKTGEGTLNYGDTYAEATGTNVPNMTGLEHPTGGYEFAGWHHDVVESSDKVVMDADHTLTAMWEPKKIYVTFRPDDTNSFKYPISPIQVRYGEKFNQLPVPDPVLPYEFIGWTLSEDGESTGTYVDDFEDVYFTEDITLMANWSSRRFTRFIYENENGEETTKGCSQMYGYAYRGVPTIPEKDGYTSKWVFSKEGSVYDGAQFFPGMLVIPDHPNTIRAVYTAVTTD